LFSNYNMQHLYSGNGSMSSAAIAQLGERQTEDLKVPKYAMRLGRQDRRFVGP